MKRLAFFLSLIMVITAVTCTGALAQGYQQHLPIEPTFGVVPSVVLTSANSAPCSSVFSVASIFFTASFFANTLILCPFVLCILPVSWPRTPPGVVCQPLVGSVSLFGS